MDINGTIINKPPISNNRLLHISHILINNTNSKLQENSLFDIVNIINQASIDPNITGLILLLKNFTGADQETLQYIGKALSKFRMGGKTIYAIGDNYSQAQYFLASYANKIYLTPQGMVDLHGFSINHFYYKSLLDKLKITSHIFRIGKYKSAVEPFLRNDMSHDARQINKHCIEQLWQNYLNIVSSNRNMLSNQFFPPIKTILANLKLVHGDSAKFALQNGWIDEIHSRSDMEKIMIQKFGYNDRKHSFNCISMYDYKCITPSKKENKIAIIVVNGAIMNGQSNSNVIGNNNIINQISNTCHNNSIKAIIVRVNSPGGSLYASELIRSALINARSYGKPIVVSMGSVAASGGYLISTPANIIIAHNTTITGSIGIFGVINTIENSLESIGIHTDGVSTSPLADVSLTKKLPTEFAEIMQLNIEYGYKNFIRLVAQSRHKTITQIEKIAQGRIWMGDHALQHGLIDAIGDFDDAIKKAVELAKINEYQLYWCAQELGFINTLLKQVGDILNYLLSTYLKSYLPILFQPININLKQFYIKNIDHFNWDDPKHMYALCPINANVTK